MKIHFRRWLWLPLVSVPLGIAFTIFPRLAHAQSTSPNIATYAFSSVGLIRGQAMRVSVAVNQFPFTVDLAEKLRDA